MVRPFKARLIFTWLLSSLLAQPSPVSCQALPTDQPADPTQVSAAADKLKQPHGSHLEPILQKIHANPDQRTKITFIVTNYRPKIEPLRQEYRQKSQEFIDYIITGQPAEKVISRQTELNHLYGAIVTQYSMMRLEIRRVLTVEQSKLYEDYRRQQGWTKR
jgi:Spy/CpxP family protein refolding chaperone